MVKYCAVGEKYRLTVMVKKEFCQAAVISDVPYKES